MSRRAKTTTIEHALRILSERTDLRGEDGVATGACMEAAERLAEMRGLLAEVLACSDWLPGLPDYLVARMRRAAK